MSGDRCANLATRVILGGCFIEGTIVTVPSLPDQSTSTVRFGRTHAGSTSRPRKHHGSHPSVTQRLRCAQRFKSLAKRCQLDRAFRPRTPTAWRSTHNLSPTKPLGPRCPSPSSVAMVALSTLRSFGPARGFYVTASAQAECYHSTYLSSKSTG
jgi:hypothetical protein